jgi:endonuclease/exonuclease/phosphatase family metal-dependent hydrolase
LDQPAELARMLGMQVIYGPAMEFQGGKYGDAILSKLPAPSASWRVVPLPWREGDRREPRVAVSAVVGGRVQFISTHLDHTCEPSDRLAQAQAINRELAGGPVPAILAGDFNCEPGSPPMAELARHWALVSAGDSSFGADGKGKSIDHILVRPAGRWRVIESRVIDEAVASDHRPVLVRLELLPPGR